MNKHVFVNALIAHIHNMLIAHKANVCCKISNNCLQIINM